MKLSKDVRLNAYQKALEHFVEEEKTDAIEVRFGICPILLWNSALPRNEYTTDF